MEAMGALQGSVCLHSFTAHRQLATTGAAVELAWPVRGTTLGRTRLSLLAPVSFSRIQSVSRLARFCRWQACSSRCPRDPRCHMPMQTRRCGLFASVLSAIAPTLVKSFLQQRYGQEFVTVHPRLGPRVAHRLCPHIAHTPELVRYLSSSSS